MTTYATDWVPSGNLSVVYVLSWKASNFAHPALSASMKREVPRAVAK